MNIAASSPLTDRACLDAWRGQASLAGLQTLVERYGPLVYSSAYRRTGSAHQASEVTRAVFLVLARRGARLRKKTILAGWLFQVTAVACGKLAGKSRPSRWWRWWPRKPKNLLPAEAPLWVRVEPEIDAALDRLSPAPRDAVLLRTFLHLADALDLGTNKRRAEKRFRNGWRKLTRRLGRRGVKAGTEMLHEACFVEGCAWSPPPELTAGILDSIAGTLRKRPACKLARRTLNALAWIRWRRRVVIGVPAAVLLLLIAGGIAWQIDSRTGHSRLISMFFVWSVKREAKTVPGLAQAARPWPADAKAARLDARVVRMARDLYQVTNVWLADLKFSRDQWTAVQPKRIDPLPHFFQPDGTVLLRHPEAQRSGLAGVLGFDFYWARADLDFGGLRFTNVGARLKGNGTYLGSLYGEKRPFKVDLNKFTKGQSIGTADELTFNNLVNDHSCLSDALAYEFFRDGGVPAARTAYAYLQVTVPGQWDQKPLGLYVMVEAVDEEFALERFGSRRTPIFKPVTYELFKHLGDDWSAYDAIYDLKTKATPAQRQRVIEFARLLTLASDPEFAGRVGDFLDLDRFARYLACEVLLSNYDSFLSNGQNFYIYLDPNSNKFGFIPWDLDLSWGSFFLIGSTRARERASIWHPWVGQNRFLERVMAVDAFRIRYRTHLEDFLARLLVPDRLNQRMDALAKVIRAPVAAESGFRLRKFEEALGERPPQRSEKSDDMGADRPAHSIKRFIVARRQSVREQLDGKSQGVILRRNGGN